MRQMRKIALMLCMALVLTMLPVSEAKADTGVTYVTEDGGTLRLAAGGTAQLQVCFGQQRDCNGGCVR